MRQTLATRLMSSESRIGVNPKVLNGKAKKLMLKPMVGNGEPGM